jgi:ABC-type microcin C transport system duplicated ATPase subunit YejF
MQDGRVVEAGPTDATLDRPTSEYTQRLLRDVPELRAS